AMDVWKSQKSFREALKADSTIAAYMKNGELDEVFDLKKSMRNVDYIFERVGLA
ncbi:MAG: adenylosuccinate lyase, partial [Ignavibacteria bacterium]|nr:adenylosuccinate lyase [Ignavibacteria bacterium]